MTGSGTSGPVEAEALAAEVMEAEAKAVQLRGEVEKLEAKRASAEEKAKRRDAEAAEFVARLHDRLEEGSNG